MTGCSERKLIGSSIITTPEGTTTRYVYARDEELQIPSVKPLGYGKKDGEVFLDARGRKYVKRGKTIRKYNDQAQFRDERA